MTPRCDYCLGSAVVLARRRVGFLRRRAWVPVCVAHLRDGSEVTKPLPEVTE